MIKDAVVLSITAILIQNVVLVQFLGICPFLGVSKKVETAFGMGIAVVFVIALSSMITWALQTYVLVPFGLEYLRTIAFILVIATLVQLVEMFLQRFIPGLYAAMGIYLPLITTNCAVLGVALLVVQKEYSFGQTVIYSTSTAIGFLLAIVLFAGVRERLDDARIPRCLRGFPITLISAGFLAMAFLAFNGLKF
ncbi:MAG: RnfABCDGE type electron transport complex subunit A [Clostridiales bacterium]|jgi:electron transport complex protein RnfA|nr:RnfABCDGE type electron transport complex subunit A [Clostridiales bacterium]